MIKVSCANCDSEVEVDVERYDDNFNNEVVCPTCGWNASLFCFDYVGGNVKVEGEGSDGN